MSTTKRSLLALVCVTAVALIAGVIFAFAPRPTFAEDGGELCLYGYSLTGTGEGSVIEVNDGEVTNEPTATTKEGEKQYTGDDRGYKKTETAAPVRQGGKINYLVVLVAVFSVLLAVNMGLIISQLMILKMGGAE